MIWPLVALQLVAATSATETPRTATPVQALTMRPQLAERLADAPPETPVVVLVSGDTTAIRAALEAVGMRQIEVLERLSVVTAVGVPEAVRALHLQPGVRRVDADLPLVLVDATAHRATGVGPLRDVETHPGLAPLRHHGDDGPVPYDGSGVSIAVVDGGFDPIHEQFVEAGETKFDVHLRQLCPLPPDDVFWALGTYPDVPACSAWEPIPPGVRDGEPDHGTLVASAAAGYPRDTPSGAEVSGVAPGARLVGLSIGLSLYYSNALSAFNWVLENHQDPCGNGSCPPIRVVNASFAPHPDTIADPRFDPDEPLGRASTALVEQGVVVVFAAGNWAGDGTAIRTSPLAQHPVPGVLGVGAYDDGNAGDRRLSVWDSPYSGSTGSSRGLAGDPATYPDIVAPGASILAACPPTAHQCRLRVQDGPYVLADGTSLAAPYISGLVAQLLQADPSLTPAEVEDTLEDSAYRFLPDEHFEPDVYTAPDGSPAGNDDHATSFDAGHGLVDAVAALSLVLVDQHAGWTAPDLCTDRSELAFSDPVGDATIITVPAPFDTSRHDITRVSADLTTVPGALTVDVTLADLPETETSGFLAVAVALDRRYGEVEFNRSAAGDSFSVFVGEVEVEEEHSFADYDAGMVRFVIRSLSGPIVERASLRLALAADGPPFGSNDETHAAGGCLPA
ncbi:MAG: S8 family serine peptidase [Actinobacteria bacterium]|nr:S8 family serine peptidase [Actinomycetota bacterium]